MKRGKGGIQARHEDWCYMGGRRGARFCRERWDAKTKSCDASTGTDLVSPRKRHRPRLCKTATALPGKKKPEGPLKERGGKDFFP